MSWPYIDHRQEALDHRQAAVNVLDQLHTGKAVNVGIAGALLAEAQVHATLAVACATLANAAATRDGGALAP